MIPQALPGVTPEHRSRSKHRAVPSVGPLPSPTKISLHTLQEESLLIPDACCGDLHLRNSGQKTSGRSRASGSFGNRKNQKDRRGCSEE